ncbi:DUF2842 domain-containing protein [Oryzibacter oryziterrae]|uniref:DUF2842 domain-containing protein n=1 Tax=Oryzibacter oryziterrae TaxID=2766474 RepID=UPI001F1A9ADC|nr:DUF2842 domain-containing protein [Oryzibacter oryziterrae]
MSPRLKKFIGTLILFAFLPFYTLTAMVFAVALLPGQNFWLQALYYAVAGLLWVLPAGVVVTWMYRAPKR